MLMTLGPIRFEVYPFNATEYDHGHESSFVEKPVLGARPPLEWVGEGAENWSIKARIFPHRFGGLGDLKKLYQARAAGRPLYLMRGDGAQMGWVVIERVSERSSHLDAEGIGRVIDVDIAVRRAAKPSNGSFFSLFSGMFS
jgi:phage protein U